MALKILGLADRLLAGLLQTLLVVLSLAIVTLMLAEVTRRGFPDWTFKGFQDLVKLLVMWLYMFGAVLATRNGNQLTVELVQIWLKTPRAWAIHRLVVAVLGLVITAAFLYAAYRFTFDFAFRRVQRFPALGWPLYLSQASLLVTAAFMVLYHIRDVVRGVMAVIDPPPHPPEDPATAGGVA